METRMNRLIKVLPLVLGILMLLFSIYVCFIVSGFKLFNLNSSIGMFYVSTYKYTAAIGVLICLIYIIAFISKVQKFRTIARKTK